MLATFTLLSQLFLFGPASPLILYVLRVWLDEKKPGILYPWNGGHRWGVREFLGVTQPNSLSFSASDRGAGGFGLRTSVHVFATELA